MDWRSNRLLNKNGAFAPFLLECRVESLECRCCCGGDDCTAAWAGYVVATGGLRRTILGIECCPGAGTVGGQVAAHLGMGSNVYGAANVVAHAMPDNIGITGCYVQAQDIFYDPSGTWVYDSDCPYYPG